MSKTFEIGQRVWFVYDDGGCGGWAAGLGHNPDENKNGKIVCRVAGDRIFVKVQITCSVTGKISLLEIDSPVRIAFASREEALQEAIRQNEGYVSRLVLEIGRLQEELLESVV